MNITTNDELKDWYWTHGFRRVGKYALTDAWLDRLYQSDRIEKAVRAGRAAPRAMALWGTSQTGKSTLLSSYLDKLDDPEGRRSALTWPGGSKVRFCAERRNEPPANGTVVLNPWNQNNDASSCISRFRLAEKVEDPQHPIEIRFATPIQIMHALAMGYATECKHERGERRAVSFDMDDFGKELDRFQERRFEGPRDPRASYELLHGLADLLELLVLSDHPRYSPLALVGGTSSAARQLLLSRHKFLPNPEAVESLAFTILWDDRGRLNETYRRLVRWSNQRRREWGDRRVFGSPGVVALLLDASSYSRLHNKDSAARAKAEAQIRRLKVDVLEERVVIGTTGGTALLDDPEDYALFQGNLLELVIPVRREAVAEHPDLIRFLDQTDLLDFPGTGRAHGNKETQVDVDALGSDKEESLFTRVLKRGKTASIVASYSRDLTIDGFSVLAKVMDQPGQPGQLTTGIATWWKAFGREPGTSANNSRSPLPLNLVMSFWGRFFKTTNVEAVLRGSFGDVLSPLHTGLGKLANPDVISNTLAVNYHKLAEDDAHLPAAGPALDKVIESVMSRPEFRRQFATPEAMDSFRAMVKDGGTDYLFRLMREQVYGSPRAMLLDDLHRKGEALLGDLFVDALPRDDDSARSREALADWANQLDGMLTNQAEEKVSEQASLVLRTLLSVPTDKLDPVPVRLEDDRGGKSVDQQQFARWVSHAKEACSDKLGFIGLASAEQTHLALHGLMEAVDQSKVEAWLVETIGHVKTKTESRTNRRYLAIRMASALFPATRSKAHRTREQIAAEMNIYEDRDRLLASAGARDSPHFRQILKPFIEHLRELGATLNPDARPPQPGDEELRDIQVRFLTR
jgi:hypothetical protein